jgi:hypothetical protein
MAVVVSPYSEEPEGENYGFYPLAAHSIFEYDEVVEVIDPA